MTIDDRELKRRRGLVWVGVFALALLVRMVYLYHTENLIYFYELVGDARAYDAWAQRLVADGGRWAETFYQAPLYPYFLAGVYRVLGHDLWVVRVVQCVLGAAGCVGVGLAGTWLVNRRAGIVASVLMALYPPAIYFDGMVQKSSLGFVLMAALLCAVASGVRRPAWWSWLACGVLAGLLGLTRENALVLVPVIAFWLLVYHQSSSCGSNGVPCPSRDRKGADAPVPRSLTVAARKDVQTRSSRYCGGLLTRRCWGRAGLVVCGAGLTLAPVALHNYRAGGEFALTTFQSGPNFYVGNHPGADGRYSALIPGRETPEFERADATALAEEAMGRNLSPTEVSDYWMDRGLSFVKSEPWAWARLMWTKWSLVWNRYEIPDTESYYICRDRSWLLGSLGRVMHFGILCPLAVLGVIVLARSDHRPTGGSVALLCAMALALAGSVAVFYVFGRYRYPLVPILAVLAGAGVVEGIALARRRAWRRLLPAALGGLAAAVWVNRPINPESELNAEQLGNLGATLAADGRLDEALPLFTEAVAVFPDGPRLRQFLADGLALTGRHAEAIPHYAAALELEPGRAHAHYNLAVALERAGRTAKALEHFRRAISVDPEDAEARAAIKRLGGRE